jgi:hypothetical protein
MKELWIEAVDHTVNGEFDAVVRTEQSSPTDIHVVEYSAYQEELKLRLDLEDLLATANEHVKLTPRGSFGEGRTRILVLRKVRSRSVSGALQVLR